jgi:hypothetical protein
VIETPQCLALVLCDQVYCDRSTGKYSLQGTIDSLQVKAFPALVSFSAYFALSGGRGDCRLQLMVTRISSLVEDELDAVGFELPTLRFEDPVQTIQACFTATGEYRAAGAYNCSLLANDEQIGMRRLTLVEARQQSTP